MAEHHEEHCLRIEVLNAQLQLLGGTVEVVCKPLDGGETIHLHSVSAAQPIEVRYKSHKVHGRYEVSVTPSDGSESVSQLVFLSGDSRTVRFIVNASGSGGQGGNQPPGTSSTGDGSLSGTLIFDSGVPASAIDLRVYQIGFGGQDALLGEMNSSATGAYSVSYTLPASGGVNLQVRMVNQAGQEVTLSKTLYNAPATATLNLTVPSSVQTQQSEFQGLSSSMEQSIGGIGNLGTAQENANQQDLTLLNRSTSWDARLIALAALAAQNATATGLDQQTLYGLYRTGLPTDPATLAEIPPATVQAALEKANSAGIVSLTSSQIASSVQTFTTFAQQSQLASTTPGSVSTFSTMAAVNLTDASQQAAFTSLYMSNPSATDFWANAASLGIAADALDALKLQGKFLYLTFNNAPLASALQTQIGDPSNLSQLTNRDYDQPATWETTLQSVAQSNPSLGLDGVIPSTYAGASTQARLTAYSGDLARKVRLSFPTETVARMTERNQLNVPSASTAPVASFLRAASQLGYSLGRTPLNAFIARSGSQLPTLDATSLECVKSLHRIFQVTPSTESMQAALNAGFTSARQIASMDRDDFVAKYGSQFPAGEAVMVWGQSQKTSSVTFNICSSAVLMDTAPPVYSLSASSDQKQAAKNSLIQQFPSIASLFGNMDYCECQDCSSVLSPAAYFVDVLEFLSNSGQNGQGYTPLDVLIGSQNGALPGRRPDLGALPLSCENANTAMPYIDLVNEILEYYVAHSHLDTNLAYDTGTATTAELTAEPENILPQVYDTTLKQALYPLNLPYDLWIATVRGFLGYFKTQLAQVLDTLRPVDALELFTDANNFPYYRAQIFAESLGLSPSDYEVLTGTASGLAPVTANWFKLYGYPSAAAALSGTASLEPLSTAENLAQVLGLTYQQLTDLLETGFLNPKLYPLIFQFQRLGISMSDAFSYTNQPGYPPLASTAAFEAGLDPATLAWIKNTLTANYSSTVLVLADPDSGCNFSATTLEYADNKTAAAPLDFLKFNLFVRLWQKLGWTIGEVDRALQAFFPANLPAWTDSGFDAAFTSAWQTALVYMAHLDTLNTLLAPAMGRDALLPLWSNLPVHGPNPLYGQLFLTRSVLNNDDAFDDPAGGFPAPVATLPAAQQTFTAHLASIQGVLGLAANDVTAIFADPGVPADMMTVVQSGQNVSVPSFTLNNLSICYRYSTLAKCLDLDVEDMIALKQMSGLNPFQSVTGAAIDNLAGDVLFNQAVQFVQQAQAVQASGFAVEDLQYLLRHQFDPVGKYQVDTNAQLSLLQQTAGGLLQIAGQYALPADLMTEPETLLDQMLSKLIPSAILKSLFALLTNAQGLTASQTGVATAIDPSPFANETELNFSYDSNTQTETLTCTGLLLDWKQAELLTLNSSATFSALLTGIQQAASIALSTNLGNILGVWASLAEYEAVETGAAAGLPAAGLLSVDPALSLSYDSIGQLQWAGYRGVLTDAKKAALAAVVMPSPAQTTLLNNILNDLQSQSMPAYSQMTGPLLAMLVNVQTFQSTASGIAAANQVDPGGFASTVATAQQSGAISVSLPSIQFTYDATSQIQTIVCQGVLTDALRAQIAALPGISATAAGLLQTVRNSMVGLFQSLATGILTVAATDLDTYVAPFLGLDASHSQRQAKAELIQVFSPLLAQKLSLDLILQTLSSNLSADPDLTEALVTDTALLSDPSQPGKALLGSFLGMGQTGVSASYYSATATLLASGIAATADTSDPTNNVAGMTNCQYSGYLQVPTDGPYRFFAELGNTGASAQLELTAPSSAALIANPVIANTTPAAADNSEISQFVNLQGGVFYQFTVAFANVGSNGAKLLVQGENLAKGPLNQIALCPQTAANNFLAAYTLLSKALQILEVTSIDLREIGYMVANASQFASLRLSSLPTQPSDANMIPLFTQMLMLIDYADLRKNPAGGTDGLIDVFQNVGTAFTEAPGSQATNTNPLTPWDALANLTRRNTADVRAIATYFGLITDLVTGSGATAIETVTAVGDFGNNKGIRRIWQALQLIQILGIPVSAVTACTAIAALNPPAAATPPDQIATNFKNAVKAQYTQSQWLPIAQSVFDPLRQQKRDALVAFLLNELDLQSENQLFEYFLVDPGMEPVVQTSRLRLAMSSVQTFIQRCLLNLESGNSANTAVNVSPSAIDSDWWSWMKRYRVWQANREIFLYPENWMEPEMRLGMSDLFQSLESQLLQGDVTNDLATQAFLDYLTGLEQRARLDVVATYFDQDLTSAGNSTLHVLARTYGHPHKYFYRTYSSGAWAAWQSVDPDIDGDHIVLAIWKGRVNAFWVTYITQQQAPAAPPAGGTQVTQMGIGDLTDAISSGVPTTMVQVQLHWCDYYQGKWSKRISSDINKYPPIAVTNDFDPSQVFIRVTKEGDQSVGEGAVNVHIDFPLMVDIDPNFVAAFRQYEPYRENGPYKGPMPTYTFRVTSKNCDLVLHEDFSNLAPMNPYNTTGVDATLYTGSGSLSATFQNTFALTSAATSSVTTEPILESVNSYALLPPSNPVVPSPFLESSQPDYQQAGALLTPFFYKDLSDVKTTDEMTFYVQPSLTETTITDWTGWAVVYVNANPALSGGAYLNGLTLSAQAPIVGFSSEFTGDTSYSLYPMNIAADWLTSGNTTVSYQGALIGQTGGTDTQQIPPATSRNVSTVKASLALAQGATPQAAASVLAGRGLSTQQIGGLTGQAAGTQTPSVPSPAKASGKP